MKTLRSFLAVSIAFFTLIHFSSAQVSLDVHAGFSPGKNINSQEIRVTDLDGPVNYGLRPSSQDAGYTVGIGLTKDLESGFFFRSELQYNYVNTTYEMRELQPIGEGPRPMSFDASQHTLLLPLSVGVRIGNVRVLSGIDANLVVSGNHGLNAYESVQDNSSNLYMGWHAGIAYDIDRVGFELRYTQDFKNYSQGYVVGDKDLEFYGNRNRFTVLAKYNFVAN